MVAAQEFLETLQLLIKAHIYASRFLMWMRQDLPGRGCQTKVNEEKLMPGYKTAKDRLVLLFGGNASAI